MYSAWCPRQSTKSLCPVPEVGVVFHEMPDDRTAADIDHRLGNLLGIVPQPHAESAAEENDFPGSSSGSGNVTCVISSALERPSSSQGQLLMNPKIGNGNHEPSTPIADIRELSHDLVLDVPG